MSERKFGRLWVILGYLGLLLYNLILLVTRSFDLSTAVSLFCTMAFLIGFDALIRANQAETHRRLDSICEKLGIDDEESQNSDGTSVET